MRLSAFRHWLRRATDDPVVEDLSSYRRIIVDVRHRDLSSWSDDRLRQEFRGAESPADLVAIVSEAVRRAIGLEPFDVQWLAGLAMADGAVAELPTGEGKTLALVFPAAFHARAGRGVHVLTFNDYLARRDAATMGRVYERLGLTVGCVTEGMTRDATRRAYAADVTYTTAKQAGFDFLRDGLVTDPTETVHRPFHAALVDEADSILIDEARIPLVIAGADDRPSIDVVRLASFVGALAPGHDFAIDGAGRNVFLQDAGAVRLEASLGVGSLFAPENDRLLEAVHCALHARALLQRDVDYLVRDGGIELIDELTGRVAGGRRWPDGLHAAVEAKEGLPSQVRGRVLGQITLQHLLRLYPFVAGTTATARTSAGELRELYGLKTVVVPPRLPSRRVDRPDVVFATRAEKEAALVAEIGAAHAAGRPVLVGTASVAESEALAARLAGAGIPVVVLNAKNDEEEAAIIARAGAPGAVTISTNMAGRGTDIRLGGPDERHRAGVLATGGLYVIGTGRHESRRIDGQLRGRAGRQGDPGESRLFVSVEDDLFARHGVVPDLRRYGGLDRGGAADTPALRDAIGHVQRVIEGRHFDMRRLLHRYSSLVELQRRQVAARRRALLIGDEQPDPDLPASLAAYARLAALRHLDRLWADHLAFVQDTRESIHLVSLGGRVPLDEFTREATGEFLAFDERLDDAIAAEIRDLIARGSVPAELPGRLRAPAATWTYLVSDEPFGMGAGLMRDAGRAAAAALYVGPLVILTLLLERFRGRVKRVDG